MTLQERILKNWPEMFPDAWKHDWEFIDYINGNKRLGNRFRCRKCCEYRNQPVGTRFASSLACTVADPIDINNWNVAMKLFRATSKMGGFRALLCVWRDKTNLSSNTAFVHWLLFHATPADHIEAAVLCKEKEQEKS